MKLFKKRMRSSTLKFKKYKTEGIPRQINQRLANVIFATCFCGLVGLLSLNLIVSAIRLNRVENLKPTIVTSKDSRNISNKVGLFMSDFLSAYFRQGQDVNRNQLQAFYGAGIDVKNKSAISVDSKLTGATLIEITDDLATYRVSYEVTVADQVQSISKVITIPYAEKDGKFYVSGLPYFSDIESYVADGVEGDYVLKTQIDANKYETERAYVEAFFKAYSSGDKTQLVPFSRTINSVSGFQFVSLDYIYFFVEGEHLKALAQVTFQDTAGFPHQENFSLTLSKQSSGSYFVEEMSHQLVAIKED